jgi:hypothetical protein
MQDGSRITNGSTGVYMNMGTFTMEGGEISENDQSVWMASRADCVMEMTGGTIHGPHPNGGMYAGSYASFIKTGGEIIN